MRQLPDNSIDAVVTDPPYELKFMGKKWDGTGIAFKVELWQEVLRVLKPGGHILAFGGTRTYHRMACAIEDAGFEIRDCIQWLYGSGFPKSMDISKAIDKAAGAEREVVGVKGESGKILRANGQNERPYQQGKDRIEYLETAPATPEAKQWEGWGTALKPANEPIVLARKPLNEATVAANVLKWGTGGINIDECRVGETGAKNNGRKKDSDIYGKFGPTERVEYNKGRFPSNIIFDEEAAVALDEQTGELSVTGKRTSRSQQAIVEGTNWLNNNHKSKEYPGDKGGASRFFYCAKASKKERTADGQVNNNHPTVKPLSLIRYLCRLITPPGGIILDPFTGSGTTPIAAKQEGFNFICIEKEHHYCDIANNRIASFSGQPPREPLFL